MLCQTSESSGSHCLVQSPNHDSEALTSLTAVQVLSIPISNYFKYEPLVSPADSIRLIKVQSQLSQDGHMNCTMETFSTNHTSSKLSYKCLSYVWGPSTDEHHEITINGQPFIVRHNLWKFLNVARYKFAHEFLWIDALSIDQANTSERNHQVQNMGRIYSNADQVLGWLGDSPRISDLFRILEEDEEADLTQLHAADPLLPLKLKTLYSLEYWNRAWITQEVALAGQKLTFLSGNDAVSRIALASLGYDAMNSMHSKLSRPFRWTIWLSDRYYSQRSLIELIRMFREKACGVNRDRIFSLLALCEEGSHLQVDYGATDGEVLASTLQSCPSRFCFCSIEIVARALNVGPINSRQLPRSYFVEMRLPKTWEDELERQDQHNRRIWNFCIRCGKKLPDSWADDIGTSFCLGAICPRFERHLFWANYSEPGDGKNPFAHQGVDIRSCLEPDLFHVELHSPFWKITISLSLLVELVMTWCESTSLDWDGKEPMPHYDCDSIRLYTI